MFSYIPDDKMERKVLQMIEQGQDAHPLLFTLANYYVNTRKKPQTS